MATTERSDVITFKGNPVTLVGQPVEVGQNAPDFQLTAQDMSTKSLDDYGSKVKIVSVVPSLDTSVCDTQTRRFNEEVDKLDADVALLTISMDLPMAQ